MNLRLYTSLGATLVALVLLSLPVWTQDRHLLLNLVGDQEVGSSTSDSTVTSQFYAQSVRCPPWKI